MQISIMHCPLAMALYIKYCQSHNRETLRDIYNQYDDFHSQAVWFITESYQWKVIFLSMLVFNVYFSQSIEANYIENF